LAIEHYAFLMGYTPSV